MSCCMFLVYTKVIQIYIYMYIYILFFILIFIAKETINETKRKPSEWEKIFANEATNKGLISKNTNSS